MLDKLCFQLNLIKNSCFFQFPKHQKSNFMSFSFVVFVWIVICEITFLITFFSENLPNKAFFHSFKIFLLDSVKV